MKRMISYPKTLKAIRQLPLEVSFDQVRYWVEQHPLSKNQDQVNWWARIKAWIFGLLDF